MMVTTKTVSKRIDLRRKWIGIFVIFPFSLTFAFFVIRYILIKRFDINLPLLNYILIILCVYHVVSVIISFLTVIFDGGFVKHHNILLSIKYHNLKNKIDVAFLKSGIYNQLKNIADNEKIAETPKVKILGDTEIHIENLVGQTDKLEKFKPVLSALLDGGLVCETLDLDMTQKFFIAILIDLSDENQKIIQNHEEFLNYVKDETSYQLKIMPNFIKDVSKSPHLLIAGETGSGKSYFLYFLIFQLVIKNADVYVIDRKKVITKFKSIIGAENVASEIDSIMQLLEEVYKETKRRESILEKDYPENMDIDFTSVGFNPFYLVIDELGSLIAELNNKQKKAFNDKLQTIAQRGRATGVNIIIAMQHPSHDNLPTSIRSQLTFKTILGNTDDSTRHLLFKADDMANIKFKKGQGYFTNSGTHNKASILFVPTFKFELNINNLKELIVLNSSRNEHKKNEST